MKPIPPYMGYYADEKGVIYSSRSGALRELKSWIGNHGYMVSSIFKRSKLVHRLVVMAYNNNYDPNKPVNHLDGNKTNNNLSNLEQCSYSENMLHSYKLGLMKPRRGELSGMSKITASEVLEIRGLLNTGDLTQKEIGLLYSISRETISGIKNNRIWKHLLGA